MLICSLNAVLYSLPLVNTSRGIKQQLLMDASEPVLSVLFWLFESIAAAKYKQRHSTMKKTQTSVAVSFFLLLSFCLLTLCHVIKGMKCYECSYYEILTIPCMFFFHLSLSMSTLQLRKLACHHMLLIWVSIAIS